MIGNLGLAMKSSSTLVSMGTGLAVLAAAAILTTDNIGWLINFPGLLIVVGGTLAATIGSFPVKEVMSALRIFITALRDERAYAEEDVVEIERVARLWYRQDMRNVEKKLKEIRSPFLRTGIQLVIDQTPPKDIMEILQWRIARIRAKEYGQAQVFRAMGTYAPAFGLVGTLLGLASMLNSMTADGIETMGASLSVALITTFYGIILANLVFKPLALKLERRTERRVAALNMIMEAVSLLRERRSPAFIRETLRSFTHDDALEPAPSMAEVK